MQSILKEIEPSELLDAMRNTLGLPDSEILNLRGDYFKPLDFDRFKGLTEGNLNVGLFRTPSIKVDSETERRLFGNKTIQGSNE